MFKGNLKKPVKIYKDNTIRFVYKGKKWIFKVCDIKGYTDPECKKEDEAEWAWKMEELKLQ